MWPRWISARGRVDAELDAQRPALSASCCSSAPSGSASTAFASWQQSGRRGRNARLPPPSADRGRCRAVLRRRRPTLKTPDGGGEPPPSTPSCQRNRQGASAEQAPPEEAPHPLRPVGLGVLGLVSMIFGMMMAVSQDLPAIYNFAQYKASKNSDVFDATGEPIGTPDQRPEQDPAHLGADLPQRQERGRLDRGLALLRAQRRRLPGHRPRPDPGRAPPERPAGRLDDHRAVRQERARAEGSRTIFEKFREAALAYRLERQWSRRRSSAST